MKHTKKMLLIPEDEYSALMSLYSNPKTDNLNLEKDETDIKMKKILNDKKLSQIEKGAKINLLSKKRRQLKKLIDNRPLKIILENKNEEKPTSGIVPLNVKNTNLQQMQNGVDDKDKENTPAPNAELEQQLEQVVEENQPEDDEIQEERQKEDTLSKIHGILKPEFYNGLKKYIYDKRQILGVTNVGGIVSNMKTQTMVNNTNLLEVLKHLTGEKEASKGTPTAIATSRLYNRLKKDEKFKEFIAKSRQQQGTGLKRKNYIIQLNIKNNDLKAKTRGLPRFRPKLWAKLPV